METVAMGDQNINERACPASRALFDASEGILNLTAI